MIVLRVFCYLKMYRCKLKQKHPINNCMCCSWSQVSADNQRFCLPLSSIPLSCQRVIFNVVNFSKNKSLYRDGMSPLVKSTSRPAW